MILIGRTIYIPFSFNARLHPFLFAILNDYFPLFLNYEISYLSHEDLISIYITFQVINKANVKIDPCISSLQLDSLLFFHFSLFTILQHTVNLSDNQHRANTMS